MATSFLTEVPTQKPGLFSKGRDDQAREYAARYESEDMARKRAFIGLWFDITAELKESRAGKEAEMMALTRRNNFKMKTEVKGIMRKVVIGYWRDWAVRKRIRRAEIVRGREEEVERLRGARKAEEALRRKLQRLDSTVGGRSFRSYNVNSAGSTRGSSSASGSRPHTRGEEGMTVNAAAAITPAMKPVPPTAANCEVMVSPIKTQRNTTPLNEKQAMLVKRLSSPPNYVPVYLRHDRGDEQVAPGVDQFGNRQFTLVDDDDSGVFSTDSFENTLAKMYAVHRKKLRDERMAKKERLATRRKGKEGGGQRAEVSEEEKMRRIKEKVEQNRITDRLFKGLGGGGGEGAREEDSPQHDAHGRRLSQRGAGRKVTKSVILEQLRKEKKSMLEFLERLQQPISGLGESYH